MKQQQSKRKTYPSDITRAEFEKIRLDLEGHKKRTKPREHDLYEVFCGLLYLLKSGCQWAMIPSDFPPYSVVYYYFSQWKKQQGRKPSLLDRCLKKSVGAARKDLGRKARPSLCIVDAQSVKNTDSAEQKGYDAGKKVSGIKRHIVVDTQGLPHALCVTTANVTDRAGALTALSRAKKELKGVEKVLVDGGYTGEKFTQAVEELIQAEVEVAKRSELHTFSVMPKRWIVERSFAWLEKCRRLMEEL